MADLRRFGGEAPAQTGWPGDRHDRRDDVEGDQWDEKLGRDAQLVRSSGALLLFELASGDGWVE